MVSGRSMAICSVLKGLISGKWQSVAVSRTFALPGRQAVIRKFYNRYTYASGGAEDLDTSVGAGV